MPSAPYSSSLWASRWLLVPSPPPTPRIAVISPPHRLQLQYSILNVDSDHLYTWRLGWVYAPPWYKQYGFDRNCNNRQTTNGIIPATFKVTSLVIETVLNLCSVPQLIILLRFVLHYVCQDLTVRATLNSIEARATILKPTHAQTHSRGDGKTRLHDISIDRENDNNNNKCEKKNWMLFSKNNSMCCRILNRVGRLCGYNLHFMSRIH